LAFCTLALAEVLVVSHPSETVVRSVAGLFQLLGIGAVARGIREVRADFNVPPLHEELSRELLPLWGNLRENWRRLLGRPSPVIVATATGALSVSGAGNVTVDVGLARDATTEERVQWLTAEVEKLKPKLRSVEHELATHKAQAANELRSETEKRLQFERAVSEQISSLALGGLRLEFVGLVWLLAGTVLASWAPEIAQWLATLDNR